MDLVIHRKDDQILKLQTDVKEIRAEKDKHKKLYNDTKIGYQRNHENSNKSFFSIYYNIYYHGYYCFLCYLTWFMMP